MPKNKSIAQVPLERSSGLPVSTAENLVGQPLESLEVLKKAKLVGVFLPFSSSRELSFSHWRPGTTTTSIVSPPGNLGGQQNLPSKTLKLNPGVSKIGPITNLAQTVSFDKLRNPPDSSINFTLEQWRKIDGRAGQLLNCPTACISLSSGTSSARTTKRGELSVVCETPRRTLLGSPEQTIGGSRGPAAALGLVTLALVLTELSLQTLTLIKNWRKNQ